MALMPRLRQLLRRQRSTSRVGTRRPSETRRYGDTVHEDALRAMLHDDPNDAPAFEALAELVRRRAVEPSTEDPLTAPEEEADRQQDADLAVWSLAEELAGHPKAWRPLLELGRLSVAEDPEGAARRFATAAERDRSGAALAESLQVLRDAGMPVEALGLGIGHWRVREQTPEVGRQLVLAALEAERVFEAKQHLSTLAEHPDSSAVAAMRAELEQAVAAAEATDLSPGSPR
ncbi:hypothetical protein GCM10009718_32120 [Isoptericola halotolerans]|uniref:Tetratricopeptide repeat protein n=1 Tax=Isoptericola halotolerans TaxID=300560 RepID=A0ABX2A8Q4_9MICO|nr:hypothetical protein [Isoptericola halotolerans]NOV99066.1 hypothetical protein [Isoptericola halotolerans]